MGDKCDVMYKGVREYTEQMSNAFQNWNEDHPNQSITKEELQEAHSLLKKLVIEKADVKIAKSWWPTRLNWESSRKMMERDIEKRYSHLCEFNGLREEWCNEKKMQMKIAEIIKELKEEMDKCKAIEEKEPKRIVELEGQIRANQKVEKQSQNRQKELALKMEVANKKYELRMENHLDDRKLAKRFAELILLATIPTHSLRAGLVVGGIFSLGTLAAYLIRSRKRKQKIKKLDKMIAECSQNNDDDDDDEDKDDEEEVEEEGEEDGQKYMDENYMNEKIELI